MVTGCQRHQCCCAGCPWWAARWPWPVTAVLTQHWAELAVSWCPPECSKLIMVTQRAARQPGSAQKTSMHRPQMSSMGTSSSSLPSSLACRGTRRKARNVDAPAQCGRSAPNAAGTERCAQARPQHVTAGWLAAGAPRQAEAGRQAGRLAGRQCKHRGVGCCPTCSPRSARFAAESWPPPAARRMSGSLSAACAAAMLCTQMDRPQRCLVRWAVRRGNTSLLQMKLGTAQVHLGTAQIHLGTAQMHLGTGDCVCSPRAA